MKILKTILALVIVIGIAACSEKEEKPVKETTDYIRFSQKMIETYAETGNEKETIEYGYEAPDDIFWVKAVHKDEEGNITKTVERKLDENRLPVSETVTELDMVTESSEMKFDPETKLMLAVKEYQGELKPENLVKTVDYEYKDGVLFSQTINRYSQDSCFTNAEGKKITATYKMRYMPAPKHRPKGNYPAATVLEEMVVYNTECCDKSDKSHHDNKKCDEEAKKKLGQVVQKGFTEFDKDGYPVHYYTDTPDCDHHAAEEWYKTEKDDKGNVIAVTGYMNKALDSSSFRNVRTSYTYDENGLVASVAEHRYNPENGKYELMHDFQGFKWNPTGLNNDYRLYCPDTRSEHYCFGAKHYSVSTKTVEKKEGVKIATYMSFDMPSEEGAKPELVELKKEKQVTVKFEMITK